VIVVVLVDGRLVVVVVMLEVVNRDYGCGGGGYSSRGG